MCAQMFQDQMACDGMLPFHVAPGFAFQGTPPPPPPPPPHHRHDDSTHQPHSGVPLAPSLLPTDPQGLRGAVTMMGKRSMSFLPGGMEGCREERSLDDDLSDDGSPSGERKKRLNVEQVRALERSFEMGNKLEPERKMQLAGALGLQPRQIAIWFQNKRARWKTKQLEKDYDALKMQLEELKSENDVLQAQNKRLHAEILALRGTEMSEPINPNKETEGSCSNSSDINLDISRAPTRESTLNHQIQGRIFFPSYRPAVTSQLLESFSRPEAQCPNKVEHGVQDENFCNIICSVDDQSAAFWAWSEQHNFH